MYLLSSNNAALLVRITRSSQEHPKSTKTTRRPTNTQELPKRTQEHTKSIHEHLGAHASTQEHLSPFRPNATHSLNGAKVDSRFEFESVCQVLTV